MFEFSMLVIRAQHHPVQVAPSSSRATLWGLNLDQIKNVQKFTLVRLEIDLHHHALRAMSVYLGLNARRVRVSNATALAARSEQTIPELFLSRYEWVTPGEFKFSARYADVKFSVPTPDVDRLHGLTVVEMR